jgi:hypothetical protein
VFKALRIAEPEREALEQRYMRQRT